MLALDVARIEAGLMLIDVDYVSAHHALIEAQKSSPFELNLGLDRSARQGAVRRARRRSRAEHERGPAWRFVGHRSRLGLARAPVRATSGLPPQAPDDRLAHERPDLRGRQAGRLRDERLLVAAPQEVHRARARRRHGGSTPGTAVDMEVTVEHRRQPRHGDRARSCRSSIPSGSEPDGDHAPTTRSSSAAATTGSSPRRTSPAPAARCSCSSGATGSAARR